MSFEWRTVRIAACLGLLTACGSGGSGEDACRTGDSRCAGTTIEVCGDDNKFAAGQDCAPGMCATINETTAQCQTGGSAGVGDDCTGEGVCMAGLDCVGAEGDQPGVCLQPCPAGNECAATEYCDPVRGPAPYCFDIPARGDTCFNSAMSNSPCEAAADACIPYVRIGDIAIGTCSSECDLATVNTQGACMTDEVCSRNSSFFNAQPPGGGACTENADCAAVGALYECVNFGGATSQCAINLSLCATSAPLYNGQQDQDGFVPDQFLCNTDNILCSIEGGGADSAPARCVRVFGNNVPFGVCVGFCEDPDGGADLGCGTAATCNTPNNPIFFQVQDEMTPVTCTQADLTNCDAEHQQCVQLGGVEQCARPRRVCVPF